MFRPVPIAILVGVFLLACARLPAPHDAEKAGTQAPPGPVTFAPTLSGQLDRIDAEGGHNAEAVVDNTEAAFEGITYPMLEKSAEKYAGLPFTFYGSIVEIQETEGTTSARIHMRGHSDDILFVECRSSTPALKRNEVMVIGYLAGRYSYTSQAGWNITIPAFAARAIITEKEGKAYDEIFIRRHGRKDIKHPRVMP